MSILKTVGKATELVKTTANVIETFENITGKGSRSSGSRKDFDFDCGNNFGGNGSDGTSKAICELVQALFNK